MLLDECDCDLIAAGSGVAGLVILRFDNVDQAVRAFIARWNASAFEGERYWCIHVGSQHLAGVHGLL